MRGLTHNPQSHSYIRGADRFMVIKYWRMCVAGRLNKEKQYLQNIHQCIILVQFLSTGFLGFLRRIAVLAMFCVIVRQYKHLTVTRRYLK